MKINIYGSTGEIGSKSLLIIQKYFPHLKINLLFANKNYKKLIIQAKTYKPKFIYINDQKNIKIIKKNLLNINIKILSKNEFSEFNKKSKSDITILSISGYESLQYIEKILLNTKNLGLVNKECIVSAGHLFHKYIKKSGVKIFPLDSEHYSLETLFNKKMLKDYNKIYLTASGGPFLFTKLTDFKNIKLSEAINHPKWKMGYKNSIDSSTLANKCLEIVEAHYLFDIPFTKIDTIIHPQAYVHSIVEFNNNTSFMNCFYPDMSIPIFNFLNTVSNIKSNNNNDFSIKDIKNLQFYDIDIRRYPIYKIFMNLNKSSHSDIIKFNCANEIGVDLFIKGNINFNQIYDFIDNALSLDFKYEFNSFNKIIEFQNNYRKILKNVSI